MRSRARMVASFLLVPSSALLMAGATLVVVGINGTVRLVSSILGVGLICVWLVLKLAWLHHEIRHHGIEQHSVLMDLTAQGQQLEKLSAHGRQLKKTTARVEVLREDVAATTAEARNTAAEARNTAAQARNTAAQARNTAAQALNTAASLERTRATFQERKKTVDTAVSALRRHVADTASTVSSSLEARSVREAEFARWQRELGKRLDDVASDLRRAKEIDLDASRYLRGRIDALAGTLHRNLDAVPVELSQPPLLSIAIPSYNRGTELAHCIESIIEQMPDDGQVELWITDDASTDPEAPIVAHRRAEDNPMVGFRPMSQNVGLERNLLECISPCRGEYLLILGNDDAILPGALDTLLDDLAPRDHNVLLYEKIRFSSDFTEELPLVPGSSPVTLDPGATMLFESPFEVAASSGLLSAFGFISQVVLRREPFAAIDAAPYFGLTMYPQVAVLLEAFATSPVYYHNTPLVAHRTNSQTRKLAEAAGRPEETFMSGGDTRAARWFGVTLAAMLQRVADRASFDAESYAHLPEKLLTSTQLADWIEHNSTLDRQVNDKFDNAIIEDATRFAHAMQRARVAKEPFAEG